MLLSSLGVMLTTLMSPAELFAALNELKELNKRSPHQAISYYQNIVSQIPSSPSTGSMELHLAGMEAAIRTDRPKLINTALNIASQYDWVASTTHGEFNIFVPMAIYHRRTGDYSYAEYLNKCALNWAKSEQQLSKVVSNLSVIYRYTEQHSKAIELLKEQLEVVSKKSVKAGLYNNLGNFYQLQNRYVEAKSVYKKAFLIHSMNNNTFLSSSVGLNLLKTMITTSNWSDFSRFMPAVSKFVEQSEHPDFIAYLYWQNLIVSVKHQGKTLLPEQVNTLKKSMPLLNATEVSPSITEFVNLLAHSELSKAWQATINSSPKPVKEKTIKRISVSLPCAKTSKP
ncbi:tetratricopeptide repeat protein [Pseudoalteromonas citrea]|nr:tetratricopeptide repeat protein [Pseudoalteromonas citrea]